MGIKINRKDAISAIGYELAGWGVERPERDKLTEAIYHRLQYDGSHRGNQSTPIGWEKEESAR